MVKRHAPRPFIFPIYPSLLAPFPGLLSCIPLPFLHPYTFFKEMRDNLQDRSCLAFSDKALIAAQGELRGYTSPRWAGACEYLQSQFHLDRVWGDVGSFLPGDQGDMQMRYLTPKSSKAHSVNPSVPWAAAQQGQQWCPLADREAGRASLHLFKLPCDRGVSPVFLNLIFMEKWPWWSQIWILDPTSH